MDSGDFRLSKDEQAVLDHVSGLTRVLPEPSDPGCEDREKVLSITRCILEFIAILIWTHGKVLALHAGEGVHFSNVALHSL